MTGAIQVDAGDVVAALALLIAIYTAWKTDRFNRRQTAFEETNERLNRLLIERESEEATASKRADVSANFVKIGKGDYRLKVFNRGKGTARNVRFEEIGNSGLFIGDDIKRKFPLPILEQHASLELIACVSLGSDSRVHVRLMWDDDTGSDHSKELHLAW